MGKIFKVYGIFGKEYIFLDIIGRSFETSGWIFIAKTNIMCQILSSSDVLKKKVVRFKMIFIFLLIKSCIFDILLNRFD